MHQSSKMKDLIETVRKVMNGEQLRTLNEQDDAPFSKGELAEIEKATKVMSDYLTDPNHPSITFLAVSIRFFTFRDLKKDINKKAPEVEYVVRNKKGMAQFLWEKERGKVSCTFSVQIGEKSSIGGFPSFVGRNVDGVVNEFMKFMKKNF